MNTDTTSKLFIFGIILPTYNRPGLLAEALRSLQEQTYPFWRAFVINDASSADYSNTESMFSDDKRIHFVMRETNGGANNSCNTGLDILAKENDIDFIAIMDDDDMFSPDYFEVAADVISHHPEYGWFMSNNYGEKKKSSRTITAEGELDYVTDCIYGKFRGDKGRLIAASILKDLRMDGRFRASHRWPFFTDIAQRTKIWAFPHNSVYKRYMEGGVTKTSARPMNTPEITHCFYKHWHVIRRRPTELRAYKYFFLELAKAPIRLLRLFIRHMRT